MSGASPRRGVLRVVVPAAVLVAAVGAALVTARLVLPGLLAWGDGAPLWPDAGPGWAWDGGPPETMAYVDDLDAAAAEDADGGGLDGAVDGGTPPRRRWRGRRATRGDAAPGSDADEADAGPPGYSALGGGRYLVKRAWLDDVLEGRAKGGGARAVAHQVDGKMVGYKLVSVSGALAGLGLQSGDVLTHVNGKSLQSDDAALGAYRRNVRAKGLRLTVLRGGAPVSLDYRIE